MTLERALAPGDQGATGHRDVRDGAEMLSGDGQWHYVTVRAWWRDRHGRQVVQVEWSIGGETWGESYRYDPERMRKA